MSLNPSSDPGNRLKIERLFATAAALEQSGQLRNTIYCFGRVIFIMNGDNTVLLKFIIPSRIPPFQQPVSFRANDYESGRFLEENGKVIFFPGGNRDDEFTRSKSCKAPGLTFQEVDDIWNKLWVKPESTFLVSKKTLTMIEDRLSHLEFQANNKSLIIIQRDIFSGTTITLNRKKSTGLDIHQPDKITKDFGPIGIRTGDFSALFSFHDLIEFGISSKPGFMTLKAGEMEGVIAWCIYDELGTLEVIEDGRKEQEDRRSKQGSDRPTTIRKVPAMPPKKR